MCFGPRASYHTYRVWAHWGYARIRRCLQGFSQNYFARNLSLGVWGFIFQGESSLSPIRELSDSVSVGRGGVAEYTQCGVIKK